jgi:hypothetical protein
MNFKHGHKRKEGASGLYRLHHNIVQRCTRKTCHAWKDYGGRGITIHGPWLDFATFLAEIPPKPAGNFTLDRIDNSKGYIPGNLRWATRLEQANNKRNNKMLTFKGKTQSLAEWSRELGINYFTLKSRINQSGYSVEKALSLKSPKR